MLSRMRCGALDALGLLADRPWLTLGTGELHVRLEYGRPIFLLAVARCPMAIGAPSPDQSVFFHRRSGYLAGNVGFDARCHTVVACALSFDTASLLGYF